MLIVNVNSVETWCSASNVEIYQWLVFETQQHVVVFTSQDVIDFFLFLFFKVNQCWTAFNATRSNVSV